ncbi:MAG: glycosyltransferase family 2 protein [Lachnospiraceae bacterium]|nr:glycosyltransferase family 2 protein [Lachnospiraceae bacterium]
MKIDVIIPLYKPGKELFVLLNMLQKQSVSIHRVILMNTEEKYFEELVYGTDFYQQFSDWVKVYHLSKREFDHGMTRRQGVHKSDADIFVMMTQDAMPTDETLVEHLTAHLQGKVAVAYARQLPRQECNLPEKISREFNYPDKSCLKGAENLEEMGIKTFFCSNVCAAYRRDIYEELGGFVKHTIFNEDMIYAGNAVRAGYRIAYEADACVLHSHNYTVGEQLRRNFDLGVSQAQHPEIFGGIRSEAEGKKMVKLTTKELCRQGQRRKIPYFYMQCAGKYVGYLLGKNYRRLPRRVILTLTANKEFWK